MNYSFLPSAEAEYLDAVRFYDEQRAALGAALITEFELLEDVPHVLRSSRSGQRVSP